MPFFDGNRSRLLIDGEATFDAIFSAIDAASDYVLLQFYLVRDDALGQALARRLIARAATGVRIYFLYDRVGSNKLSRDYLAAAAATKYRGLDAGLLQRREVVAG